MTSKEMTKTELPSEKEIQLKLQERSTLELVGFQKKLKHPRYSTDPQALTIRFHLVQELLTRHLMGADAYEMEAMAAE